MRVLIGLIFFIGSFLIVTFIVSPIMVIVFGSNCREVLEFACYAIGIIIAFLTAPFIYSYLLKKIYGSEQQRKSGSLGSLLIILVLVILYVFYIVFRWNIL